MGGSLGSGQGGTGMLGGASLQQILPLLMALQSKGGGVQGQPLPNASPSFGSPTGGAQNSSMTGNNPGAIMPSANNGGGNLMDAMLLQAMKSSGQNGSGSGGKGGGKGGMLGGLMGGGKGGAGAAGGLGASAGAADLAPVADAALAVV